MLCSAQESKIMINPRGVKIVANTVGFFIANDAEEVRRANAFCKVRKYFIFSFEIFSCIENLDGRLQLNLSS